MNEQRHHKNIDQPSQGQDNLNDELGWLLDQIPQIQEGIDDLQRQFKLGIISDSEKNLRTDNMLMTLRVAKKRSEQLLNQIDGIPEHVSLMRRIGQHISGRKP